MLESTQLSRSYGEFKVVDDVGFTIEKGEIVGLLGHNGAGKTTIMKMLSGFLEPDSGKVIVDGVDLSQEPEKVQSVLGYLPENLPVYPEMTVLDYLDYAAGLKGFGGQEKVKEVKRVVKATDIADKLLSPINTLSRGYKQRVGVAQAILGKPRLLILDEPTNGLDPHQTHQMRELIRHIAKDATVILSTHIMQEVEALCSRVLILSGGKLTLDEQLDRLKNSHQLLVSTSMADEFIEHCQKIDSVISVALCEKNDKSENGYQYKIELDSRADQQTISAELAKVIVENKARLYLLKPEHRDLETLFKEVNEQAAVKGGGKHAA